MSVVNRQFNLQQSTNLRLPFYIHASINPDYFSTASGDTEYISPTSGQRSSGVSIGMPGEVRVSTTRRRHQYDRTRPGRTRPVPPFGRFHPVIIPGRCRKAPHERDKILPPADKQPPRQHPQAGPFTAPPAAAHLQHDRHDDDVHASRHEQRPSPLQHSRELMRAEPFPLRAFSLPKHEDAVPFVMLRRELSDVVRLQLEYRQRIVI